MASVQDQSGYVAPPSVLGPDQTLETVTADIGNVVLTKEIRKGWLFGLAVGFFLLQSLLVSMAYLLFKGTGIWGLNIPVGWGFAIINFVWWIGIGHAGTLISAILLLLKQEWRMAIARFAEAMTIFAVLCAAMFPLIHTGRPWLAAYWLFPYPNTMNIWPNFRSPLDWDVFAVGTYFTVSLLFWYVGLVPDLAALRDRTQSRFVKLVFGILSMGWRGSAYHWHRYEVASLTLAGLSTPLVVSVHTIVSFDFAVSVLPGWHTTIFPPYFVAGAVYSGFAMVLTFLIPARKVFKLEHIITMRHIHNMSKVMLATGLVVLYGYTMELFIAWYSAAPYEQFMMKNRMFGPDYGYAYWILIFCNGVNPQLLWFKRVRENMVVLFIITLIVNVGMWFERFIIVVSTHRDFLPSSWDHYTATAWDWSLYVGTIGLFITMMFLFMRLLPMISIFEVRTLVPHRSKPSQAK